MIDANFAVGSIFGIWPGKGFLGKTGRDQVASVIATYGPRTTMMVALPGAQEVGAGAEKSTPLSFEMTFNPVSRQWHVSRAHLTVAPSGKVFAPGNLRATGDLSGYKNLFNHWLAERYTLRYTGGMVPDVLHILLKGKGVFANVASSAAKAKLRLLYECAPIALLMECAGGARYVCSLLCQLHGA